MPIVVNTKLPEVSATSFSPVSGPSPKLAARAGMRDPAIWVRERHECCGVPAIDDLRARDPVFADLLRTSVLHLLTQMLPRPTVIHNAGSSGPNVGGFWLFFDPALTSQGTCQISQSLQIYGKPYEISPRRGTDQSLLPTLEPKDPSNITARRRVEKVKAPPVNEAANTMSATISVAQES